MKISKVVLKDYVPSGDPTKPLRDVFIVAEGYDIERIDDTLQCMRGGTVVWQTHVSEAKWWTPIVESAPVQAAARVAAAIVGSDAPKSTEIVTVRRGKLVK